MLRALQTLALRTWEVWADEFEAGVLAGPGFAHAAQGLMQVEVVLQHRQVLAG